MNISEISNTSNFKMNNYEIDSPKIQTIINQKFSSKIPL